MGIVYEARQKSLQQLVALKMTPASAWPLPGAPAPAKLSNSANNTGSNPPNSGVRNCG